jgi:pimeloyl-ACP methyl ester carboxylesterase
MVSLRMVGTEVSALGAAALSLPLRLVVEQERIDPGSPHPTPVVLVHGFLGDPTNFLFLRRYLEGRGIRSFASFSYAPRIDYQRLACQLGQLIDALCEATGSPEVDVVGHSLGGLVARYLLELPAAAPIRRLVSLGSPYFAHALPEQELAIFAAADPFIPAPHPAWAPPTGRRTGRMVVVPECGHWGLLYHQTVWHETATYLSTPPAGELPEGRLALEAAS